MTSIRNTEYKLQEAKFFLDKLEPHRPFFDFYLSAFLNASRSVTWIMRHEYGKNEEWLSWFNNSKIEDSEKILLDEINDFRIQVTKKDGIKTEFLFVENFVVDMSSYQVFEEMQSDLEGKEIEITISNEKSNKHKYTDDGKYIIKGRVKKEKNQTQKSREDFLELCIRYYNFLHKKVDYCNRNF